MRVEFGVVFDCVAQPAQQCGFTAAAWTYDHVMLIFPINHLSC
jgi:hypothetical protein